MSDSQYSHIRRVFDWRLMCIPVIPLMILTVAGKGYFVGPAAGTQPLDFGAGLALQFLVLSIVFASFGIVIRFGRGWLLPVLLGQSVLVGIVGERLEIFASAGLLLYSSARIGISMKRAQMAVGIAGFLLIALVLTSARATEGRISPFVGGSLRFDWLVAGIVNITSPDSYELLAADIGYRLDGNSFGAMELQALAGGASGLGPAPLVNDVLLAIPSFLNPDKTATSVEKRSEKDYAEIYLGLPLPEIYPGVREDILPTQLGAVIGYWGPLGLMAVALFLGILFGLADQWILRRLTPSRLLIGIGLLSCVVFYERSWDTYTVTFRGIALVWLISWSIRAVVAPTIERRDLPLDQPS